MPAEWVIASNRQFNRLYSKVKLTAHAYESTDCWSSSPEVGPPWQYEGILLLPRTGSTHEATEPNL